MREKLYDAILIQGLKFPEGSNSLFIVINSDNTATAYTTYEPMTKVETKAYPISIEDNIDTEKVREEN